MAAGGSRKRPFPGFAAIYQLHDPLLDAPYRGQVDQSLPYETEGLIGRGQLRPAAPIVVRHAMGGGKPWEVIWTTGLALVVHERVVDLLASHDFTGWTTYPVEVHARRGGVVPGYHGLAITGRCGMVFANRSRVVDRFFGLPVYQGLTFRPETWDGSDLFQAGFGSPFVVAAVKAALEGAGIRNILLRPLPEVRAEGP